MHCAVAVAAVAAAINNKKSLPKRHTEPFSDGFSPHLWSPIQCISTISFFLSFSIWIYSIHKMNANKSVKYKQTNKQIDLAVKYVICSFLNEMKWNELERMRVVQMLNERRNCKWRALEFFRMILEQLKTSGGDSFVLQSIHCVCVCRFWQKLLPVISFVKLSEFPQSLKLSCYVLLVVHNKSNSGMFGRCFFLSCSFLFFCLLWVQRWIESTHFIHSFSISLLFNVLVFFFFKLCLFFPDSL